MSTDTTTSESRPIVVIDAFNVFVRHFAVNESMTNTGEPCGGVVGFIRFLHWVTTHFVPSKLYVVWEQGGGSPRRKKLFPEYKANRMKIKGEFSGINKDKNAPPSKRWVMDDTENKLKQVKQLVDCIRNMPVCQLYVPDSECDDVIAYLIKQKLSKENAKKIVISNDKDFYQLLEEPNTVIYDQATKMFVDADAVMAKYGIAPRNFALARAIIGDPSDNIPGVPGIAFKTAQKRFTELLADQSSDNTVDSILNECRNQVAQKTKVKIYETVLGYEETIRLNWKLMFLDSSDLSAQQITKIDYAVENFQPKMDKLGLIKCLLGAGIITDLDFDRIAQQMRISLLSS
jgi:DNA polymerase I